MAAQSLPLTSDELQAERWLPVVGFDGYEVSDMGRVRSTDRMCPHTVKGRLFFRHRKGVILKPGTAKSGHQFVVLGRGNGFHVHVLVLLAFVGPCPPRHESLHGDGNAANNRKGNLRWGTRRENVADAIRHGTFRRGEATKTSKLTEANVREIRKLLGTMSLCAIGKLYGVKFSAIRQIRERKSWKHVV